MTKEEILQYIKSELANENAEIYLDVNDYEIIVKALEQAPIIDKIRTEIEQIVDEEQKYDEKWAIGLRYAVKIIDKYNNRK